MICFIELSQHWHLNNNNNITIFSKNMSKIRWSTCTNFTEKSKIYSNSISNTHSLTGFSELNIYTPYYLWIRINNPCYTHDINNELHFHILVSVYIIYIIDQFVYWVLLCSCFVLLFRFLKIEKSNYSRIKVIEFFTIITTTV